MHWSTGVGTVPSRYRSPSPVHDYASPRIPCDTVLPGSKAINPDRFGQRTIASQSGACVIDRAQTAATWRASLLVTPLSSTPPRRLVATASLVCLPCHGSRVFVDRHSRSPPPPPPPEQEQSRQNDDASCCSFDGWVNDLRHSLVCASARCDIKFIRQFLHGQPTNQPASY